MSTGQVVMLACWVQGKSVGRQFGVSCICLSAANARGMSACWRLVSYIAVMLHFQCERNCLFCWACIAPQRMGKDCSLLPCSLDLSAFLFEYKRFRLAQDHLGWSQLIAWCDACLAKTSCLAATSSSVTCACRSQWCNRCCSIHCLCSSSCWLFAGDGWHFEGAGSVAGRCCQIWHQHCASVHSNQVLNVFRLSDMCKFRSVMHISENCCSIHFCDSNAIWRVPASILYHSTDQKQARSLTESDAADKHFLHMTLCGDMRVPGMQRGLLQLELIAVSN